MHYLRADYFNHSRIRRYRLAPVDRLIVSASTVVGIALVPLQLTGLAETLLKETRAREAQQKSP